MRAPARHKTLLAAIIFVAGVLIYPLLAPDSYHIGVGITAGAMAASTVGVVLLLGLAHQLAIGQAAFSMIGGYATAIFASIRLGSVSRDAGGRRADHAAGLAVAAPILKLRGFVLVDGDARRCT